MARLLLRLAQGAAIALVGALLALLVWEMASADRGEALTAAVRDGKKPAAPPFELPVIWNENDTWPSALRRRSDDGRVSLAELRGWPVVLNFWASWCTPCKAEAPVFASAALAQSGRIVFLGIDIKDFTRDARRFASKNDVNFVSVRDTAGIAEDYGLTGLPETFFVDRRGRVVVHVVDEVGRAELRDGMRAIAG